MYYYKVETPMTEFKELKLEEQISVLQQDVRTIEQNLAEALEDIKEVQEE